MEMAQEGMARVAQQLSNYPLHIQVRGILTLFINIEWYYTSCPNYLLHIQVRGILVYFS
jgi:hypothetical protein